LNLNIDKILRFLSGIKIPGFVFFILLFFLCLYFSYDLNFVYRQGDVNKIHSDKAHYYVYLPATFIYGWDARKFPAGVEKQCEGFLLDKQANKIAIKTTCGIAILWAPFFLATHAIAVLWNLQPDGFSVFYQKMTILPGVFYLVLGLFFLWRFLSYYFSRRTSWITVLLVLAGTNLFYYGIFDGLMSHVNSFFLFSLFLFLLKKFLDSEKRSYGLFFGLSIVLSMAILIRPTNILLVTWMLFLDVRSWKAAINRIFLFLKPGYILIFLLTAFIIFLPQLMYWKYLTGKFLYYSYPGESFSNWNQPQLVPVWFSTLNGLFIYSPLVIFFIAGMIIMLVRKVPNSIFVTLSFLLVSYVFASWFCWFFGGSFGYRPMVEYYTLFSLPFAYFIRSLTEVKNLFLKSVVAVMIFFFVNYNIRLTYRTRWDTNSVWSWDDYFLYLDYAGIYHYPKHSFTSVQDFENKEILGGIPTRECVHSPTLAGYVDKSIESKGMFSRSLIDILAKPMKRVSASVWINPGKKLRTGALFVCRIADFQQKINYEKVIKVDDFITKPGQWAQVSGTFEIPEWIDQGNVISFTIVNAAKTDATYVDDLKLRFE
jgi:hypothetical protein